MPVSSHRQFAAYFIPLALQSMAQSVTYPLVAMVASRGPGGPLNMAGLAQSSTVIGIIWTLGAGLFTAGMVYGRTREGYERFTRINTALAMGVGAAYLVAMIPVLSHWIFAGLIGLPPSIEHPARLTFASSLPLVLLFAFRNPYLVILFNHRATTLAFGATAARIALTLILSPAFCYLKAVGPIWAVVCLTVPVAMELLVSRYLAMPYIRRLPSEPANPPGYGEIMQFATTLSVGALFLALSGFLVGAFISRAPAPEHNLPAYYMAMGLVSPVAFGCTRIQPLVISFFGQSRETPRQLLLFAISAGLLMGFIPLAFLLPRLIDWYYVGLQRLNAVDLPLVRATALTATIIPITVALRAYCEGKAAYLKKPVTILTGQAVYLAMIAIVALAALNGGAPGYLIGVLALAAANLASAGIVTLSVRWEQKNNLPVPPTYISEVEE